MHRICVWILALALGCAPAVTSSADRESPGQRALPQADKPAAKPTAPPATQLEDPPKTTREGISSFVERVREHIEAHEWDALLAHCDPAHREIQIGQFEMGKAQYLAEILGLHMVDNSIKRGATLTFADINRIDRVTIDRVDRRGAEFYVEGEVTLDDHTTLALSLMIHKVDGRWYMTGAVG